MNRKGQSLVVFVLTLPLIFILVSFVIATSTDAYTKIKCENDIKSAIRYGLRHIKEDNIESKMITLLDSNIDGDKEVKIEGEVITINLKKNQLNLTFTGHIENGKMIIESK